MTVIKAFTIVGIWAAAAAVAIFADGMLGYFALLMAMLTSLAITAN